MCLKGLITAALVSSEPLQLLRFDGCVEDRESARVEDIVQSNQLYA